MKLKLALPLVFVLCASFAYSSNSDSLYLKKVSHHFQLLIGNYASEAIAASSNVQYPKYVAFTQNNSGSSLASGYYYKPTLTPLYSYALGFNYQVEVSKYLGLRTGLSYFTYGYAEKGEYYPCPECLGETPVNYMSRYKLILFTLSLQLPLQLVVYKNLKRGRFIFSCGPDFYLPLNSFGLENTNVIYAASPGRNIKIQNHVAGINFFRNGTFGFSAGFGYERALSKKLSIQLMPDFHLLNLLPFYNQSSTKNIYQNYIFNTAMGLSTYLSFTK